MKLSIALICIVPAVSAFAPNMKAPARPDVKLDMGTRRDVLFGVVGFAVAAQPALALALELALPLDLKGRSAPPNKSAP